MKKKSKKESSRKKQSKTVSKNIATGKVQKRKSKKTYITKNNVQITKGRFSKKSWYFSKKNNDNFYADSLLERYRMELLDSNPNVLSWTKRHGITIPYMYKGKSHYTIPDFLIKFIDNTLCLEEVKGRVTQKELIKKQALEQYCINYNLVFSYLTSQDLDKDGKYSEYIKQFKKPKKK